MGEKAAGTGMKLVFNPDVQSGYLRRYIEEDFMRLGTVR